jgi:hypothetical protein
MTDFSHVDCAITRSVLEGCPSPSPVILRAAYYSQVCQLKDYKSQHITDCVYAAREKAVSDMWQAFNAGNETAAVQAMRSFWSV